MKNKKTITIVTAIIIILSLTAIGFTACSKKADKPVTDITSQGSSSSQVEDVTSNSNSDELEEDNSTVTSEDTSSSQATSKPQTTSGATNVNNTSKQTTVATPTPQPPVTQPDPTPAPKPTCGSTDHTTHPVEQQHYHGNGSDSGTCPNCGQIYAPPALEVPLVPGGAGGDTDGNDSNAVIPEGRP